MCLFGVRHGGLGSIHLGVDGRRRGRPNELALLAEFGLGQPAPQQDEPMDGGEDDDEADGDAKDVGGNESAAADPVTVEEAVRVKALLGGGDVGDAQIGEQTKDKPGQVGPRQGIGARDKNLEEGEGRVEGVLADVAPGVKDAGEPGRAEEDGPVDEADDDGQGDDGRVKERVQGLQGPRQARERGPRAEGVDEGVEGGDEEVKGLGPVAEDGEVGKGALGLAAAAAELGGVGALPADDEEDRGKGPEGLFALLVGRREADEGKLSRRGRGRRREARARAATRCGSGAWDPTGRCQRTRCRPWLLGWTTTMSRSSLEAWPTVAAASSSRLLLTRLQLRSTTRPRKESVGRGASPGRMGGRRCKKKSKKKSREWHARRMPDAAGCVTAP